LTFDYMYSKEVIEDLPRVNITYLKDVPDHLSDLRINCYTALDLTNAYSAIPVYRPYRHIFAFEIQGFPQLVQPI